MDKQEWKRLLGKWYFETPQELKALLAKRSIGRGIETFDANTQYAEDVPWDSILARLDSLRPNKG